MPVFASILLLAAAVPAAHALDFNKAFNTAKQLGKVAKGVAGIGPQEELTIGESVAIEIIGQYGGLVRDEAITRRVNLVGRSLAYYSSRPALEWKFGVLDSPSVNGFSAPGGFVFITRGLYDLVGSDDDALAAVLAHEIAHITGRHALNIIARGEFVTGAAEFAASRSGDVAKAQAQLKQFDTSIGDLTKTILEKGFDPQTEFGADQAGRDLAMTVGYAPGALRQVLVQLQQKSAPQVVIFSTHPPLDQRIARLPEEAAMAQPHAQNTSAAPSAAIETPGGKTETSTAPKPSDDDAALAAEADANDEFAAPKKKTHRN